MTDTTETNQEAVAFNGISGGDGGYPFARTTVADLAALARGERLDAGFLEKVQRWLRDRIGLFRDVRDGFRESLLEEAGWGVVFPQKGDPRIRAALQPLLDRRKGQAGAIEESRYYEFCGDDGYLEGESMRDFLLRHRADLGAADPRQMPYYLLLVGAPEEIPFSFQYELDLRHAVGRLDFDTPEEYGAYAASVVATEEAWAHAATLAERRAAFFCPRNTDVVSIRMRDELVGGLAGRLEASPEAGWRLEAVLGDNATKEGLREMLGGSHPPDFLFTACHGLVFPLGDRLQREKQGALACRSQVGAPPLETSVSASDIPDNACVHGLIALHFGCYSAGTPGFDEFERKARVRRAERPFTARLPQRLLSHPNGGALAVIGHIERAWTYSFTGYGNAPQLNTFEDVLRRILRGEPVGRAVELFNLRHAEMAAELLTLQELEELEPSGGRRDSRLAIVYCAAKDARNYVVLGDPAVRLTPSPPSSNDTGGQE